MGFGCTHNTFACTQKDLLASRDLVPVNTALQNQRSIRQAEQQRVQENKKSMKG
jgi:hypothetical protein